MAIKILGKNENGKFLITKTDENFNPIGEKYEGNVPAFKIEIPTYKQIFKKEKSKPADPEVLEKRFELRVTKTEKKIIDELKKNGVNVSEILRKALLKIDPEVTKQITKEKVDSVRSLYTRLAEEYQNLFKEFEKMKFVRGETQKEAQDIVNIRYATIYLLDDLEASLKINEKFLKKYKKFLD